MWISGHEIFAFHRHFTREESSKSVGVLFVFYIEVTVCFFIVRIKILYCSQSKRFGISTAIDLSLIQDITRVGTGKDEQNTVIPQTIQKYSKFLPGLSVEPPVPDLPCEYERKEDVDNVTEIL